MLTLALLGVTQSGKTSLANCLLGHNEYIDESHKNKLDLFKGIQNNDDGYKRGYFLGKEDYEQMGVIDTKSYDSENKDPGLEKKKFL